MQNLIEQSTTLPISLSDIKKHCRVDHSDDDAYLTSLIWRAVELIEAETNRDLRECTWELYLKRFPPCHDMPIILPRGILATIESVLYYDSEGVQHEWEDYYCAKPWNALGWIVAQQYYPNFYPSNLSTRPDAVTIQYTTVAECTEIAKQAICLAVGTWNENREDATEARLSTIPGLCFQRLVDQLTISSGVY